MPDTLTLASTKNTSVVVPIGTDFRKAASVRTPFQTLANWLLWVDDKLAAALAGTQAFAALAVTGNATVGGTLGVTGTLSVTGDIAAGGGLMRKGFAANVASDSDQSIERNAVTICAPVGSGPYIWTIFGASQQDGDWVEVFCNTAGTCTLKDPGGGTLLTLNGLGTSLAVGAKFVRVAGVWRLCGLAKDT